MQLILLCLTCLVGAFVLLTMKQEPMLRRVAIIVSTLVAFFTIGITVPILWHGFTLTFSWWRIDGFAAVLMLLVGCIQWTANLVSLSYIREELHEGLINIKQARNYYALIQLFVLSMLVALASNNLGMMWIALEATTLATTLLVAFYTHEGSLEAAWKYLLLCSVGISLGLLGVLLVVYAATTSGLSSDQALTWTALRDAAHNFSPALMRWAFVFIFIGFGTKVGLVPMHTWLPDAHGRTPSPVSGLLSGVLLNVALFAILRYKSLVDAALGDAAWSNRLFIFFGALSFIIPSAFILLQKNYKRLLAYSSIEHMGLSVFAFGLGLPGMIAVSIHMIGHSLAKSMLFFSTGNILLKWKSTKIDRVGPVMKVLPYTGMIFLIGLLALLAMPPSPLFWSEWMIFSAAFVAHPLIAGLMLLAGAVIFAGVIRNLIPMLYQKGEEVGEDVDQTKEKWNISHFAMALHLIALLVLGIVCLRPETQTFLTNMMQGIL